MDDLTPKTLYQLVTDLVSIVGTLDSGVQVYVPVAIDVAATIDPGTKRPLEPEHYHDAVVYQAVTGFTIHKHPDGRDFVMLVAENNTHPQADPDIANIEWETPSLSGLKLRRRAHEAGKQIEEMERRKDAKVETRFIGFCHECDMPMFAEIGPDLGRFECPCGKSTYVETKPTIWAWEG